MSISVVFNGILYSVPETGEEAWGETLTTYLVAIPTGCLQKTGGTFTLTADTNFGANYGLLSKYFSTRTTAPSTAGLFRLAISDTIGWRNNANAANLLLAVNGSDQLTFNGTTLQSTITVGNLDAQAVNAQGLALVANVLSTQSADATHPGMVNNTTQTLGSGVKTFTSNPIMSGLSASQAVVTDGSKALASLAYASANTVSTLVQRDGSGNFSAGTITANLTGTASQATNATNVGTTQVTSDASFFPLMVASSTNGNQPCDLGTGLTFNPSTNTLTTTTFVGAFSGTVTNAINVATTAVGTNASFYPLFVASTSDSNQPCDLDAGLSYNPSSNTLTTTTFSGALSGTATNATNVATTAVSSNASFYPLMVASSSNGNQACDLDADLSYNPSTNILSAVGLNLSGLSVSQAVVTDGSKNLVSLAYTDAATASVLVSRDANANSRLNALINNFQTVASAAATTTLTVSSAYATQVTGSTTQNVALPSASTLVIGQSFLVLNRSSGAVTVKDGGGSTVQAMAASSQGIYTVTNIGSTAGVWDSAYTNVGTGSSAGTVTSVGMTVPTALFDASPVSGSPITTSGTLAPALATQTARTFFSGPLSGSAATPTFKALTVPAVTSYLADPTGTTTYAFVLTGTNNATVGAVYNDGAHDYTVTATISAGGILLASGTATPVVPVYSSYSNDLTKSSGSGDATINYIYVGSIYTPSTSPAPLYSVIEVLGAGGSGGASGHPADGLYEGPSGYPSAFYSYTDQTKNILCNPGVGAALTVNAATRGSSYTGTGGVAVISNLTGFSYNGNPGAGTLTGTINLGVCGGSGGASYLGAGGLGGFEGTVNGGNAATNSGAGGGGGYIFTTTVAYVAGPGGGAGSYAQVKINNPSGQYICVVGAKSGGMGGFTNTGGDSGSGLVRITEYFQ